MRTGKESKELTVLNGYGKKRLLTYAESFLSLASLFEQEEAGTEPERPESGQPEALWGTPEQEAAGGLPGKEAAEGLSGQETAGGLPGQEAAEGLTEAEKSIREAEGSLSEAERLDILWRKPGQERTKGVSEAKRGFWEAPDGFKEAESGFSEAAGGLMESESAGTEPESAGTEPENAGRRREQPERELPIPVTPEERAARFWQSQMAQNRALMAGHLKGMAQIMETVARQSFRTLPLAPHSRRQMIRALKEQGIQVQDVYLLEQAQGRLKIGMTMRSVRPEVFTVEEIADFLSVFFGKQLLPEKSSVFFLKREWETVVFEERARYSVLTGVARAIKENEKISGDNYSFQELSGGRMAVMLSDGMGSGEKACRDSTLVIELLEKYLETGFSREMAIEMVNGVLLARGGDENLSTLDLCDIDLYDGTAALYKAGCACTYIRHENGVEMLPSATLPLGVLAQPEIGRYDCKLAEGECIIMLSDGVIDSINSDSKETMLRDIIGMLGTQSARELANNILQFALHQSQGKIRDDMTVLTLSLWESR